MLSFGEHSNECLSSIKVESSVRILKGKNPTKWRLDQQCDIKMNKGKRKEFKNLFQILSKIACSFSHSTAVI
jgi:hypothetical protein